jgi:hypothetical protein
MAKSLVASDITIARNSGIVVPFSDDSYDDDDDDYDAYDPIHD